VAGLIFFATCVAPLLLAIAAPAWLISLAYAGEGFAVGIFVTAWETALQSHIRPDKMARVGAWDWLGTIGGMPIGYALTGPVVDAIGTGPTLVCAASASILLSLVFVFTRELRDLRIEGPVPVPSAGVPRA
jgi:predicted MFS family arabinose efflux permease